MERSLGAEALLDASWTIPWLDHSVFPYWPEAVKIGDLEVFLEWLTVQDGRRAALVLTHAREFEKVHRLVTRELTRDKSAKTCRRDTQPNSGSWRGRRSSSDGAVEGGGLLQESSRGSHNAAAASAASAVAATTADSRPRSREGGGGSSKKHAAGRVRTRQGLRRSGSADGATFSSSSRRRTSRLSDGGSGSVMAGGRNFTQSWPPSSRRRNIVSASAADPPLRSCRRALVAPPKTQAARPTGETGRPAAAVHDSRQPSLIVAPQPRRVARQWNVRGMDPPATSYPDSPPGDDENHAIESVALLRGGRAEGNLIQPAVRRTSQAAASVAPSTSAVTSPPPPPPPATVASFETAPSSSSTGRSSARSRGRGKSGRGCGIPPPHPRASRSSSRLSSTESHALSRRASSSLAAATSGGLNGRGGGSKQPPSAAGVARERSNRGDRRDGRCREDGDRPSPSRNKHIRMIEDSPVVASTPARTPGYDEVTAAAPAAATERPSHSAHTSSDSISNNVKRRPPLIVVPCPSPERQIRIQPPGASSLEGVAREGAAGSDEPQGSESWLCMRDPVTLRKFWFDPKTHAAEWEGGGAMEDAPGGMGLGLLSLEERERLAKKFERRQRRGKRGTDAAAGREEGGEVVVVVGSGRVGGGGGLREHVLRKLTLEGGSGGGSVEQKVVVGAGAAAAAAAVGDLVPDALKSA